MELANGVGLISQMKKGSMITPKPTESVGRGDQGLAERLINRLSRRESHDLAIGLSKSRFLTRMSGHFPHANALYRAGRYPEAVQAFILALENAPNNPAITGRLVTAAIRSSERADKSRAAEALVGLPTAYPEALTRVATAIATEDGFEEAEKYLWHAYGKWDSAEAHVAITSGLEKSKVNQWRILEVMLDGEAMHRGDSPWILTLAEKLAAAGRFQEAAERYRNCSDELKAPEHYNFGYYAYRSGDGRAAERAYSRAIAGDSELNASRFGLGVFHENARRWGLAARAYRNESTRTSNSDTRRDLFTRAAYCYEAELEYENALEMYKIALELNPRDRNLWMRKAKAFELLGDYTSAYRFYRTALQLTEGHDTELSFRLGYVVWLLGEPGVAIEHFLRFVGIDKGLEKYAGTDISQTSDRSRVLDHGSPGRRLGARAHTDWADTYYGAARYVEAARHYRRAFLSGGISRSVLGRWVESLVSSGDVEEACRVAVEWRANPEATPHLLDRPRRGGIESRNTAYESFRRNLAVREDIIMFESSLGLAVDCHPLAISRFISERYPGKYIHAWVVSSDVPLPADLESNGDIITVEKGSAAESRIFASAGYIVNNSTFPTHPVLRDEQRYLNTWHGTPLKTMMKDTPDVLDYANISRNFLQATALLYPSEYARDKLLGRTGIADMVGADVRVIGSPRNDNLVPRKLSGVEAPSPDRILLAPTWRRESDLDVEIEKLAALQQRLSGEGRTVLLRTHHYVEEEISKRGLPFDIVPRSVPTNDLLPTVDLLVTDYSSIFFDFAITRRPIVFYVPDWDRYEAERGLYLDRSELPGAVCNSIDEVEEAVSAARIYDGIDDFLETYGKFEDGSATERAVDLLFGCPTFGDIVARPVKTKSVLLRGEFLANGISSALNSMANALDHRGVTVGVLTGTDAVRADPIRQQQLAQLHDSIGVLGRVGTMVNSPLEYHSRRILQRAQGQTVSPRCMANVETAYKAEYRRVLGTSRWSAVVEYEGYSEFWADFVLGATSFGAKTSIFMHNDIAAEIEMKFPWMERIACRYPKFDAAVSVSADLASVNQMKLASLLAVDDMNIKNARNIVDPIAIERGAKTAIDADLATWLGTDPKFVLNIGRLSPEKNHEFLIAVFRRLVAEDPSYRLVICGDGPLRSKLQAVISKHKMDRNIILAGHRDTVHALMGRTGLFVLPSLHEGQPIVLLEAAVLGTPCLGSNIPAIYPFESLGVKMCDLDTKKWADIIGQHFEKRKMISAAETDMSEYINESVAQFSRVVGVSV